MEEGEGWRHLCIHSFGTHDLPGLLRTGFMLALEFGAGILQDAHEEIEIQSG